LADSKIIAEAWDASGAYQVGSFAKLRWAEWNGRYRDDIRRFWRGDPGMTPPLATRLAGSSDLYQAGGRQPYHSINFVTSHDGFTMNDLVSYLEKHNEANEEGNRDGETANFSSNYGVEGPSRRPDVEALRLRQIKNLLATLFLSQGVPMLLYGDECRRTQRGNNNAYCQDNALSWFDWKLVEKNAGLVHFCKSLIQFRRSEAAVRRTDFLNGEPSRPGELPDVQWFAPDGKKVNWTADDPSLTCFFAAPPAESDQPPSRHVLLMFHAGSEPHDFVLPQLPKPILWRTLLDTRQVSPHDIFPNLDGPFPPPLGRLCLDHHSMMVFVSAE